jgi:hypothetical protein
VSPTSLRPSSEIDAKNRRGPKFGESSTRCCCPNVEGNVNRADRPPYGEDTSRFPAQELTCFFLSLYPGVGRPLDEPEVLRDLVEGQRRRVYEDSQGLIGAVGAASDGTTVWHHNTQQANGIFSTGGDRRPTA